MQEHRVYGPPGTGKTRFLTQRVEHAAKHYGPGAVMASSYTTAAATEIASRAPGIPEDNIGTLHKFCYAAIGRMPVVEEKKKSITDWNEFAPAYAMSMPGCKDINSGLEYGEGSTLGDSLLALTTVLRNRMIPREQWPSNAQAFIEAWSSWKNSIASIDYTDMLEIALRDTSRAPGTPQIIFVDEAQDCTALQFAVLKKWAENCDRLVMVGDDDQCIYQFAGATPEAFACAQIGENDKLLDQSYRVPFKVWEHAIEWIGKIPNRVEKDYYPKSSPDPGFVRRCPFTWKQGEQIVEMLWKILHKYQSVMVIGSCSYMLEPVRVALLQAGIPFHNPYRYIRADWNPLRLGTGTTFAQRVAAFFGPELTGYERKWWTPAELRAFGSVLSAKTVFNKGMKTRLENDEIERVDLETLFTYFTEDAVNKILHQDLSWWAENLVNDEAKRKAVFPLKIVEKFGKQFLDAEEIPPFVTLGTIHSVKGGEADVVIIFPDMSQEGMTEWTGKGKSAIRRLMYVGITRAREGVYITKPASPYTCDL